MSEWYTEEVAGDVYIFDHAVLHAFGQPQCAPIASAPYDFVMAMDLLCLAHNADIAAITAERDEWRELCIEAQKSVEWARAERDELQRRLDAVIDMLVPEERLESLQRMHVEDLRDNDCLRDLHVRAVEIAEGKA